MANRIVMNSTGMKISQPGVNVLTAAPQQLLFNSDWGGATVGVRGEYYVGAYGDYAIPLPRAFGASSLIFIEAGGYISGGMYWSGVLRSWWNGFASYMTHWYAYLSGSFLIFRVTPGPDWGLGVASPAVLPPPFLLRYAIVET